MPYYPITVTDANGLTAIVNVSITIQPSAKIKPLFNPIDNSFFNILDNTSSYSGLGVFDYFEIEDDTFNNNIDFINIKESLSTAEIIDNTTHTSILDQSNDFMPYQVLTTNTDFQLLANRGYVLDFALITDTINLILPLTSTLFAGDRIEFYPLIGKALILPHPDDAGNTYRYQESDALSVELDNDNELIGFVYTNAVIGWLPQFKYDLIANLVLPSTLNNNIVASWTFEQSLEDSIGNSDFSTLADPIQYTTGIVGDGYLFGNSSTKLFTASNAALNVLDVNGEYNTDFSIAFFTNDNNSSGSYIVSKYGTGEQFNNVEYDIIYNNNEGSRSFFFRLGFVSVQVSNVGNTTVCYFVAATFNLATRKTRIYVKNLETNNVFDTTLAGTVPITTIPSGGDLNVRCASGKFIDGLAMWKKVLSTEEITELLTPKQYPY